MTNNWDGLSVLVADDSAEVQESLARTYENLGFKVAGFASNGIEVMEQLDDLKPDLVSLDVIMPEMDGIECFRKIQEREDPPKCLIVSALSKEPRIISHYAEEIHPDLYVRKPVAEDDLMKKLSLLFTD